MNKQEVIEKIERRSDYFSSEKDYDRGYRAGLDSALLILRELDEPEKAVLNEEEAEWLGRLKKAKSFLNCLYIITRQGWGHDFEFYVHEEKYKLSYRDDNDEDSEQTKNRLVNALIYGYEVEKEKLYTLELPNPNSDDHLVLRKNFDGKVCVSLLHSEYWRGNESTQLTEAEIKEDFEWAWQFSEEVEE